MSRMQLGRWRHWGSTCVILAVQEYSQGHELLALSTQLCPVDACPSVNFRHGSGKTTAKNTAKDLGHSKAQVRDYIVLYSWENQGRDVGTKGDIARSRCRRRLDIGPLRGAGHAGACESTAGARMRPCLRAANPAPPRPRNAALPARGGLGAEPRRGHSNSPRLSCSRLWLKGGRLPAPPRRLPGHGGPRTAGLDAWPP